jgi:hypothetical protein
MPTEKIEVIPMRKIPLDWLVLLSESVEGTTEVADNLVFPYRTLGHVGGQ